MFLDAEFASIFIYINGADNTAVDGLSRLLMKDDDTADNLGETFSSINNLDREWNNDFLLDMQQIMLAQVKDSGLQRRITPKKFANNVMTINSNKNVVTTFNSKVWVPKDLQQIIVKWYHANLQHAGITWIINMIGQTFVWKGLHLMVEKHIMTCDNYQRNKNTNKKASNKIP